MLVQQTGGARQHFLGGGITVRSAGGGAAAPTYAEVLRDTYGASEVWPLVNIASGTTITAFINSARNGTETGWALQNAAGPVTGTLAPLSDGTSDFGNILTASLQTILNVLEGGAFGFCKVSSSGVWTDGSQDTAFSLFVSSANNLAVVKEGVSNNLRFQFKGNNVTRLHTITGISDTGWFSWGIGWSSSANEVKFFKDGAQVGTTQAYPAWSSTTLASALIGAFTTAPALVWNGWLAYTAVRFGSVWSDANFAAMHAAAASAGPDV